MTIKQQLLALIESLSEEDAERVNEVLAAHAQWLFIEGDEE